MKSIESRGAVLTPLVAASVALLSQGVRFEPVQKDLFAAGGAFANAWADYDGDGDLDQFVGFDGAPNRLYRNDRGTFTDVAAAAGLADTRRTVGAVWFDSDEDGDLYVNGTITGGPPEVGSPNSDHGVQWADFDLDGDLDLALTGGQKDGMHWLLRNPLADASRTHAVNVRVLDENGRSTLAGAEVAISVKGLGRLSARLVDAGSGYNAQNDAPVHLVLPERTSVLQLRVRRAGQLLVSESVQMDRAKWGGRVYEFKLSKGPARK